MNGPFLLLAAMLTSVGVPPLERGTSGLNSCPAETQQAHEIAIDLATDPYYATTRASSNMPQVTAANVRLLTDATDATKCAQMFQNAQYRAVAWGGTLEHATPVFYAAGGYYFAVMTYPPPPPPPPPGHVHVRLGGWVAVYIFDSALSVITVVGM
jgi:hypothetical protein